MKKITFLLVFITVIHVNIFCQEQEAYTVFSPLNYKYTNAFVGDTSPIGKEKVMFGSNITCYGFFNERNTGIFVYGAGITKPVYVPQGNDGSGILYNSLMDFILGCGFRLPTESRFMLLFGLGLNINTQTVDAYMFDAQKYIKYDDVNLGFGGQAAVKFNLTSQWNILLGFNVSYSFLNYREVYETYKDMNSGWSLNSILGCDVFLGIGANTTYDRTTKITTLGTLK
jgi:hypothetical protein